MNRAILSALCRHFNLGFARKEPQRVHGGLVHAMWRVDTDKASYAVKQLSRDTHLLDPQVVKNYEVSERVACHFSEQGIPAVSAIDASGKHLLMIDGTGFLVYPYVAAEALDQHAISESHALKMAVILADMQRTFLKESGLSVTVIWIKKMCYGISIKILCWLIGNALVESIRHTTSLAQHFVGVALPRISIRHYF